MFFTTCISGNIITKEYVTFPIQKFVFENDRINFKFLYHTNNQQSLRSAVSVTTLISLEIIHNNYKLQFASDVTTICAYVQILQNT